MEEMLTLDELHTILGRLLDQGHGDAFVTFGADAIPVKGGIVGRSKSGEHRLNLAPTKLDQVGGF